jgi:hypothetical protein
MLTNEGAVQFDHSLDHAVEFFSKAGSLFATKTKKNFYGNTATALELFKNTWISGDKLVAMKLLFWLRDPRGGSGNRSAFRECVKWVVETDPKWVEANVGLIPEHGRWDDLRVLFGSYLEENASKLWADAIIEKNALAAKWADRSDKALLKYFRQKNILKDIGDFRRYIAKIRKEHIPEHLMCSNLWNELNYQHVPSVAMSRYTKAFKKHDAIRFEKFKEKVEKGEEKINAGVLFPHDLVRLVNHGDAKVADLQFAALPDYLEGTDQRIMCIVDSSGSMDAEVGGSVKKIDVSTSLGLYCSDRIGKGNPFYRKFMQFCSESKLTSWEGMSFSECYSGYKRVFDGAVGATYINKALDSLLNHAKMFKATNDQIPNVLLIISDMQFHQGTNDGDTEVNNCMKKWEAAGYTRPRIVYWNLDGCAGSPELADTNNVGLVSGFSPAILKAILAGTEFTPKAIMLRAIEKYKVVSPA